MTGLERPSHSARDAARPRREPFWLSGWNRAVTWLRADRAGVQRPGQAVMSRVRWLIAGGLWLCLVALSFSASPVECWLWLRWVAGCLTAVAVGVAMRIGDMNEELRDLSLWTGRWFAMFSVCLLIPFWARWTLISCHAEWGIVVKYAGAGMVYLLYMPALCMLGCSVVWFARVPVVIALAIGGLGLLLGLPAICVLFRADWLKTEYIVAYGMSWVSVLALKFLESRGHPTE